MGVGRLGVQRQQAEGTKPTGLAFRALLTVGGTHRLELARVQKDEVRCVI